MYYIHVVLTCWNLCGSLGTSISKHLHLKAFHCEPQKDPVLRTSHSSIALLVTTDLLGILHEQSWSNDKNGPHSTGQMPANAVVVGINWLRKGGVLSPRRLSIDVTCVFCAVGLKYYTHLPINGPEMLMRPLLTFGPLLIYVIVILENQGVQKITSQFIN